MAALAVVAVVLAVTGPHLLAPLPHDRRHLRGAAATARRPSRRLPSERQHPANVARRRWSSSCPASSGSSGAHRLSPASSRPARSAWPGPRASPAPAGWPSSSRVVGLASMAVAGLLSLMVTWWASPLDRAHMDTLVRDLRPTRHRPHRLRRLRLRSRRRLAALAAPARFPPWRRRSAASSACSADDLRGAPVPAAGADQDAPASRPRRSMGCSSNGCYRLRSSARRTLPYWVFFGQIPEIPREMRCARSRRSVVRP